MDWSFNRRPLKHRTSCDYCDVLLGIRRYTDNYFNRVYCSEDHLAEGRLECIREQREAERKRRAENHYSIFGRAPRLTRSGAWD
jgi:hypothetical protein